MTITVKAVYSGGVLKPLDPLPLSDNQTVSLELTTLPADQVATGSLFGAFPELAALTDNDFAWAKRLWEHSVENQSRILDGLT